jgi:RecA/RadA recombinase
MSKKQVEVDDDDLVKSLNTAIKAAEKKAGLAQAFLNRTGFTECATSTGSLVLDGILGGGIPPGRIIGIVGPEHSGKSLIATEIIRHQLLAGRIAVYYDAEGGTDPLFLGARGINLEKYRGKRNKNGELSPGQRDNFLYYQPTTGGEIVNHMSEILDSMPESRQRDQPPQIIFVLDSVVALISDSMSEDIDSNKMAMHARMYAEILPIINGKLVRSGCSLVYVNQMRQRPGVMMGSPFYEPGGDALKFFSSIRLNLSSTKPKLSDGETVHPFVVENNFVLGAKPRAGGVWEEPHREGDEIIGVDRYQYTGLATIKNKVFQPKLACWIRIQSQNGQLTGRGLDPVFDIFTYFLDRKFIAKAKPRGDEKAGDVAKMYDIQETPSKKLLIEWGFPERFDYCMFKDFVDSQDCVELILKIRKEFLHQNSEV